MGVRRLDRVWLLGGVVAVLLLVAAGWFLLIGPEFATAGQVQDQAGDEQTELITQKKDLAALQAKYKQVNALKTALKKNQAALPATSGVPAFLRQLQDSGTAVNVDVSLLTVAQPQLSTEVSTVYELPITLTATGSADNLSRFLDRLQKVQARAVLLTSVGLTGGTTSDSSGAADPNGMTASLALTAFVSPTSASKTALTTK
jgi:type IV pilus assembly protein PilO